MDIKVLDIIIAFVKAIKIYRLDDGNECIWSPKYLLGQILRQYRIGDDKFLLSVAAKNMWSEITNDEVMLMYGKEASNRKQEIDRQHYTIPNQRPKDKHCGKI